MPRTTFSMAALFAAAVAGEGQSSREAVANLKAIYVAERAYFNEVGEFTEDATEVGFTPERGNRFAYYFNATGAREVRDGKASPGAGHVSIVGPDQVAFPRATFPASPAVAGCRTTPAKSERGEIVVLGVTGTGKSSHFLIVALAAEAAAAKLDCWLHEQP